MALEHFLPIGPNEDFLSLLTLLTPPLLPTALCISCFKRCSVTRASPTSKTSRRCNQWGDKLYSFNLFKDTAQNCRCSRPKHNSRAAKQVLERTGPAGRAKEHQVPLPPVRVTDGYPYTHCFASLHPSLPTVGVQYNL